MIDKMNGVNILVKGKLSRYRSVSLVLLLSFLLVYVSSSDFIYAATAEGSVYSIGKFSTTPASSIGNGTEYTESSSSVLSPVTNDAQGLESGAVLGITGNAVLTQNKIPMINSYSIDPDQVNQSSWVRLFISAVYTNRISANITRPDDIVDTINLGYQSVYYYPYTNLLGRYDVVFIAEGNSVVTAEDHFDVVEVEEPYVPPEEDDTPRRNSGGSSGTTLTYNALYISILHICNDTPKIILEVTNDTGVVSEAFVNVKSAISGDVNLNFTTDNDGLIELEIPVGDYTITASAPNHIKYSRNYELHCDIETINLTNISENQSNPGLISGQVVSDALSPGEEQEDSDNNLTAAELESASRILDRQSTIFTASFLAYLVFTLLIFVFAIIVLLKLYSKDAEVGSRNLGYTAEPRIIILENKTLLDKKLVPIEKEIMKIEEEIEGLSHKDVITGPVKSRLKGTFTVVDVPDIRPISLSSPASGKEVEVQKTLDEGYIGVQGGVLGLPYKKPSDVDKSDAGKIVDTGNALKMAPKTLPVVRKVRKINPYLLSVPEEHAFVVCDGNKVYTLKQLLRQLKGMSEDTFKYHVTDSRNDFATWIYGTIGYKGLAEAIGPIKSKGQMIDVIDSKINSLVASERN